MKAAAFFVEQCQQGVNSSGVVRAIQAFASDPSTSFLDGAVVALTGSMSKFGHPSHVVAIHDALKAIEGKLGGDDSWPTAVSETHASEMNTIKKFVELDG